MFSEMDKLVKSLLVRLYAVKVEPLQKYEVKTSSSSLGNSNFLQVELQSLSKKLFDTKLESLKLAHSQLLGGILSLQRKEEGMALEFFKLSSEYAADAHLESINFAEKELSTRMRVLSALFSHKYTNNDFDSELLSQEFLQLQCKSILDDLLASNEVKKAIDKEITYRRNLFLSPTLSSSSLMNAMTSPKILSEVSSIIHFTEEQAHFVYTIPTVASGAVDLHTVQDKLSGHKKRVTVVLAHKQYVFSGAKDNTIKVWDVSNLKVKATLRGHKGPVSSLVVVNDTLYSGSADGTVRAWSTISLKEKCNSGSLLSEVAVRSLAGDADSNSVFVGCNDGVIRVLDGFSLTSKGSMKGHSHWVSCLAVSNGLLCSGSVDTTIKLWDISSLMCVGTLIGHSGFITSLSVSGDRLFSGSFDKTVKVWNLNTLSEVEAPQLRSLKEESIVRSLAITNNKLYVGDASDQIRVINLSTLKEISSIQAKPTSFDNCMTVSDGKLFIGSAGKTIHVHLI